MNDTVSHIEEEPTEDTLAPITSGIPVTMLGNLGRWPAATVGEGGPESTITGSRAGSSFPPPPTV